MFDLENLFLFIAFFVVGILLEITLMEAHFYYFKNHKKENHFTWSKYWFLLSLPFLGLILLGFRMGINIVWVYIVFAAVGTTMEWFLGFAYHQIVGSRLWTYHKHSLWRYTSWLTMPFWGFIGVLFYLVIRVVA